MLNKTILALAFWLAATQIFAQPMPCTPPEMMTSTCEEACIICDINGFTGRNSSSNPGEAPPGFCTNTVHNAQWIAFMAGSMDLTLKISVSGCQTGGGLEVGIYESLDCQTFKLVSACDGDIPNNTSQNFTMTNLTVGQYYYFVMDGNMGDKCNYTINVLAGSTNVSELTTSGNIVGNFKFCPGVPQTFEIEAPTGATQFDWKLDGISKGSGKKIDLNFLAPGVHQLCCTASNACDEAPPVCTTLVVETIEPQFFTQNLCTGECLTVSDTTICETGDYEIHRTDVAGCDSAFFVSLKIFQSALTKIDLNICDGDSIFVAGKPFFKTGNFVEIMQTTNGCDSTIQLNLQTIICEMKGKTTVQNVACFGGSTGGITFSVTDGTPPFTYVWQGIGQASGGIGNISGVNIFETIQNLPVGNYAISVADNFGNDVILLAEIGGEKPLEITGKFSDFSGFEIDCAGGNSGKIEAAATGGKPPYQYFWSNNSTKNPLENVPAGQYFLTLTDANNCTQTIDFQLDEPTPVVLEASFENPNCDSLETGKISANSATGGVGGYEFSISGNDFSPKMDFENLGAGDFELILKDKNGCTDTAFFTLVAPEIPVIELGEDQTILLGESTRLNASANVFLENILWSPPLGLSCLDCAEPEAAPVNTTIYTVQVSSKHDCTTSDSVAVRVEKKYDVFAPNIFSPNDDGRDDFFTLFGGKAVAGIKSLNIFSRWGELVFQKNDFAASEISTGWDGTFRGKKVNPGVFSWTAEVVFLDGEILVLKGSVGIVR